MVLSPEVSPDFREGSIGHLPGQVHGDLPGMDEGFAPPPGLQLGDLHVKACGDGFLNVVHRDDLLLITDQIPQHVLRHLHGQGLSRERRISADSHQGAFQLPNVAFQVLGQKLDDLLGEWDVLILRLLAQDGDSGLDVGQLEVRDEAPPEAGLQSLLCVRIFLGRPVARQHDLLPCLIQRVEGVEELFLRALLSREKLNVVDQQHVDVPVALPEVRHSVIPNGVDDLVGKLLGRDVGNSKVRLLRNVIADGIEQVCLAQSDPSVDKERVVRLRGRLGDAEAGSMGELIARADDKPLKGILRIQVGRFPRPDAGGRFLRRSYCDMSCILAVAWHKSNPNPLLPMPLDSHKGLREQP